MSGSEQRRKRKDDWWDACDCSCGVCDLTMLTSMLTLVSRLARPRGTRTDAAVTAAIRGYRKVSPRLPTRCRFTPTCSAYGLTAVQRYGSREGLRLTVARLARCRPGVGFGTADPVP